MAYRVRLSRDECVPPGLGGELVQLLHQVPLATCPSPAATGPRQAGRCALDAEPAGQAVPPETAARERLQARCVIAGSAYHEGFSLPGRAARPPRVPGSARGDLDELQWPDDKAAGTAPKRPERPPAGRRVGAGAPPGCPRKTWDSPFQSRNEPEAEAREPRLTGDRISGSKQGSWRGAVKSAHADGHYVPWRRRWVVGARSSHAHVPRRGPGGLAGHSVFEPEEGWRASC